MSVIPKKIPSKWWYVGHFFLSIITRLAVYILYRDANPKDAKKHLIISIIIPIVQVGLLAAFMIALGAGEHFSETGFSNVWENTVMQNGRVSH